MTTTDFLTETKKNLSYKGAEKTTKKTKTRIKKAINQVTNFVLSHYNSISTNYLVSADVTKIGNYGNIYIAVDHASRCIIGHAFSTEPFNTETIIQANLKIKADRAFLPPFNIWHTDRESLFKNDQYIQIMQQNHIQVSRGSAKAFENQVIESLNRTFKNILRKLIAEAILKLTGEVVHIKQKGFDIFKEPKLDSLTIADLVTQAIQIYNNTESKTPPNKGVSPNQMEEALFLAHGNKHPDPNKIIIENTTANQLIITKNGEIQDSLADAYRATVIAKYKGDWLRFFCDWRKQQEQESKQVLNAVIKSKDLLIEKLDEKAKIATKEAELLNDKYESLYQKFLDIQKQTSFLKEAEAKRQEEIEHRLAVKLKRKNAIKQPIRQTVTIGELQKIIPLIKAKTPYIKARRTVALFILYLTGLRVKNLLTINVKQLLQLLNQGHTEIFLIKGGSDRHPIRLAYKGKKLLETIKEEILLITQFKSYADPAFTSKENPTKVINDDNHEQELNEILVRASDLLKKHLRTHSFRASIVTQLLKQGVPIQDVKDVIGHTRLESTLKYYRSSLHAKDIDKIISKRYHDFIDEQELQTQILSDTSSTT